MGEVRLYLALKRTHLHHNRKNCRLHRSPRREIRKMSRTVTENEQSKPRIILFTFLFRSNKNIDCVPKGHVFGKKSERPLFGMKELLCESQPCLFKRDFGDWMAHLNHLRLYVKKRKGFGFKFEDLFDSLLYYDKVEFTFCFSFVTKSPQSRLTQQVLDLLVKHVKVITASEMTFRYVCFKLQQLLL